MSNGSGNPSDRPSDPGAKPSEGSDAGRSLTLAGFLDGDRLYLSLGRNQYVEFRREDVRNTGDLPVGQAPFFSEPATWVELEPNAPVEFVRTGPAAADDFAVEVRLRGVAGRLSDLVERRGTRKICDLLELLGQGPEMFDRTGKLC